MEEDTAIASPSRKTVKGESLRTTSKQSRSKHVVEDSNKDPIKTHPRAVKGSQATKAHTGHVKLHVQIPQSQSEAIIQPHPPIEPVRRAKSSPSAGTVPPPPVTPHPLGGLTKPLQPPTTATSAPPPTDHSPTTLTGGGKISDSSPNMAHKLAAPPLISVSTTTTSTAARKPQLGSFASVPVQPQHLDPARQRMMDRAIKARLYFLRRIGPNKFLIGGDSLESRFHVNIGPQTCSCNRVHCLHLLFVMLRVLKVKQSSPMLWAKQLRNYEAESLLRDFQTRTAQRHTTPRKGSRKKFDFLRRNTDLLSGKSSSAGSAESLSSLGASGEVEVKTISPDLIEGVSSEDGEGMDKGEGEGEGEGEEEGESDKEEDICPICLNELDEGEDLLVCPGCTNHLHQHCMDIWAMEERRKNESVHCPVCRTLWPYNMASPSANYSLDTIPVSVPATGERGMAISPRSKAGSSGSLILNQEKIDLLDRLKEMFEFSGVEGLFSSDWKTRETTLSLISREAITLLLPQIKQGPSTPEGSEFRVQSVCMEVVRQSCGDSVLKVFLASLELLKVLLGYSVCHTADDALRLQEFIKPILQLLLIRCADAQHRVKDCSVEAICNLCLGQEGALSLGSACGQKTSHAATNTHYVLQVALLGQDKANSWQWWLGRLMLMDRILNIFSAEFITSQCIKVSSQEPTPAPSFDSESDDDSGQTSPCDSITSSIATSMASNDFYGMESETASMELEPADSARGERPAARDADEATSDQSFIPASRWAEIENNLLMQMWYFSARASQVPRAKVGKLVRRVIIRVARILRDDPLSLEVVHDVVGRCHRTQAHGLLDRVLHAREGGPASYDTPIKQRMQESHASSLRMKTATNKLAVGTSRKKWAGPREKGEEPRRRRSTSLRSPSSSIRDRSVSPSSASVSPSPCKTPPTSKTTPPVPIASSSLKSSLEEVRLRRDFTRGADNSGTHASGGGVVTNTTAGNHGDRVTPWTTDGSNHGDNHHGYSRSHSKESRRVGRQKSRNSTAAADEFVASDESFQSAVSELDLDCSASTILAHEERGEELAAMVVGEGLSSGSNSHDSRKHNTSSSSSVEKGVESVSVTGFPYKPGYMNFPHMYMRQTTAESAYSSDSQDTMWNPSCKNNIEEEEAAALAKVRSMVLDEVPHPPLSGLAPPTPRVLIHVQASSKDRSHDEDTDNTGDQPYVEGVHWVKGKLIGTGAFCSCFLARDMDNGTMFAVKQVSYARNTRSQEEEELSRLRDEVSMLGRIIHPNIVRCLGATQHEGHINIFIEWMAGGCLDQLLHDFGYFGENVICNYIRQVTLGIVFLHENGIIHRDLKGGNILVDSTGRRLRIADFGAAARLATNTTASGEFQNMEGTVAFMAPEVVRGGTDESVGYGRKCDVWSIGCVLLQMATAKPPWVGTYDAKNKFQLIFKIGQATAPPPMPEFANPALKDFAIRCLEVRPEDRPSSIELLKHPLFTTV